MHQTDELGRAATRVCGRSVSSALIVIDMLNPYDHEDADLLLESVRGMIDELQALIGVAREEGLPMIYVNDHHEDWTAGPTELVQQALSGEAPELIKPILPPEEAPFIVKARHSIFYQTLLEYLLRREGIDRLVLAGQVTEQCILYSALDGYMRHFEVIVDTQAIACIKPDLAEAAIQMMKTNLHTTLVESVEETVAAWRSDQSSRGGG
jgi:nicotinamidase-related amidase